MHRHALVWIPTLLLALVVLPHTAEAQRRGGGGGRAFGNALRGAVGAPQVTEQSVLPSEINAGYAAYDEENPLSDLQYINCGIANYDSFFQDLAHVKGTLALSQYTVDRANALLDGGLTNQVFSGTLFTDTLGTAVNVPMESRQALTVALITGNFSAAQATGSGLSQQQFEAVRTGFFEAYPDTLVLRDTLPATVDALANLSGRVTSLSNTAPTLVTGAPDAFAGPQAVNLPQVTGALTQATTDIANMPGQISAIAQSLAALTQSGQ